MTVQIPETLLHEGLSVDILFGEPKPMFGDLFRICGEMHPNFSPTGDFGFDRLADLQFDQVDDYFGIRSLSCEGDDVPIWLFPLAGDRVVDHHPGPFDGVRMTYGILRNPSHRAEHFYRCVQEFAVLGREVRDHVRDISLGSAPNLEKLRRDVDAVIRYWPDKESPSAPRTPWRSHSERDGACRQGF